MLFNTVQYVIFLPVVVLIYYVLPERIRYIWLLASSYYFYMQWSLKHTLLLFTITVITYTGGLILENQRADENDSYEGNLFFSAVNRKKICLLICIIVSLGFLLFYKYFNFAVNCLNRLLTFFQAGQINLQLKLLLPVGISFYTLQSLGYLIDVYRGEIYAERNFFRYALFVSFFPQLVAGPVERSGNLLVQLRKNGKFTFRNLKKGTLMIIYGMFLKMVIADRAAIIVDTVFGDTDSYHGFYIAVAALFFAIQIYCDFYGYSTIARGSALIMGIHLIDNFVAPYYAKSIKEFWRRWHISLSGWFRDYLYIPLGGNRKGFWQKECNLLFVFLVSGLWHGAMAGFAFWGLLHGLYQVISDLWIRFTKLTWKVGNRYIPGLFVHLDFRKAANFSTRLFQQARTVLLVTFAWIFFRIGGFSSSLHVIKKMLSVNNWTVLLDGSLYGLGVPRNYMYILLLAITALFAADYYKYKGNDVAELVLRQGWIFQVAVMLVMVFAILLYGCYGTMYDVQQFIYFQF